MDVAVKPIQPVLVWQGDISAEFDAVPSRCGRVWRLLRFRLFSAILWLVASSAVIADDWYRWRGPDLNGISSETNWVADRIEGMPPIVWTCEVGTGFSSIVVRANRVYTLGHLDEEDIVYCFDASTGEVVWRYSYSATLDDRDFEGGPTSTPTIDDDRVYVVSRAGELFCLSAEDATVRWKKQLADELDVRLPGWGCAAAPLIVGEKLLLNFGESGIALNKHSGDILWRSADKECGYAAPTLIPGSNPPAVVFASARAFIGVDVETGKPLWSERWLTSFNCNAADPIIDDGRMFLCSGYNRGAAMFEFIADKPNLVWKTKEMQNQLHSSLLYQGFLYGIDGDMDAGARLKCMRWATGEVVWSVDDLLPGGLAIAADKLLLLSEAGELVVAQASPDGFSPIARGQVLQGKCRTVPVLSGGRVYCRSIQGQVACVDLRE